MNAPETALLPQITSPGKEQMSQKKSSFKSNSNPFPGLLPGQSPPVCNDNISLSSLTIWHPTTSRWKLKSNQLPNSFSIPLSLSLLDENIISRQNANLQKSCCTFHSFLRVFHSVDWVSPTGCSSIFFCTPTFSPAIATMTTISAAQLHLGARQPP